eukprot:Seg1073.1 transcript_id=Seg1073.1/GoldUCD/mRNA.D3Y31 product=BET1 protein_id=Seg1073.1/GoldUCD/D3Y31
MRRAGGANHGPGSNFSYEMVENENENMVNHLSTKVQALKSLSIEIGQEVKHQNKLLGDMDSGFDETGSFLSNTMNRLTTLTKRGHHKIILYLLLFCLFVFFIAWFMVRFG